MRPIPESNLPYRAFDFKRFANGSEAAGHLIHREAVPLPLKGKDNARLKLGRDLQCRAIGAIADLIHRYAVPLPLIGEGIRSA